MIEAGSGQIMPCIVNASSGSPLAYHCHIGAGGFFVKVYQRETYGFMAERNIL
jgi:hypothetical protein